MKATPVARKLITASTVIHPERADSPGQSAHIERLTFYRVFL